MQFQATFPSCEHSSQIPGQSTPLMRPILHLLMLIAVDVPRSIDLLRGHSLSLVPNSNRNVTGTSLLIIPQKS